MRTSSTTSCYEVKTLKIHEKNKSTQCFCLIYSLYTVQETQGWINELIQHQPDTHQCKEEITGILGVWVYIVYTDWFKYGRPKLILRRLFHLMDQSKAERGSKATEREWANSSTLHSNTSASTVSVQVTYMYKWNHPPFKFGSVLKTEDFFPPILKKQAKK